MPSKSLGAAHEEERAFVLEKLCRDLQNPVAEGDDHFAHLGVRASLNILSCACELETAGDILSLRGRHRCS